MPAVPKEPILNASIVFAGTGFSTLANKVEIKETTDKNDTSTFQGGGYKEYSPGMDDADVSVHLYQDRAEGSVHQVLAPIYRNKERKLIVVKVDAGEISKENPAWAMVVGMFDYLPIGAENGKPEEFDLSLANRSSHGLKEFTTKKELEEFETSIASIIGGGEEEEEGGVE
jgi:hypothetical protein